MGSITIPESVNAIGTDTFKSCFNLANVYVKSGLNISSASITNSANIWRYEVPQDQSGAPAGKTLVNITSREQGSGTEVACGAMGDNYVIRSVPSGVTLTHSCGVTDPTTSPFDVTIDGITWTCTILQENGVNTSNVSIAPKSGSTISGAVTIPSTVTCLGYTEIGRAHV